MRASRPRSQRARALWPFLNVVLAEPYVLPRARALWPFLNVVLAEPYVLPRARALWYFLNVVLAEPYVLPRARALWYFLNCVLVEQDALPGGQDHCFNRVGDAHCVRLVSVRGRHGYKFAWWINHCARATSVRRANLHHGLTGV